MGQLLCRAAQLARLCAASVIHCLHWQSLLAVRGDWSSARFLPSLQGASVPFSILPRPGPPRRQVVHYNIRDVLPRKARWRQSMTREQHPMIQGHMEMPSINQSMTQRQCRSWPLRHWELTTTSRCQEAPSLIKGRSNWNKVWQLLPQSLLYEYYLTALPTQVRSRRRRPVSRGFSQLYVSNLDSWLHASQVIKS